MSRPMKGAVPQRELPRSYWTDRCPDCARMVTLGNKSLDALVRESLEELREHAEECAAKKGLAPVTGSGSNRTRGVKTGAAA